MPCPSGIIANCLLLEMKFMLTETDEVMECNAYLMCEKIVPLVRKILLNEVTSFHEFGNVMNLLTNLLHIYLK